MHHEDSEFLIKVGDLLREPGRLDYVEFEDLWLSSLEHLLLPGVSGTLKLQGVTDGSIHATLQDVVALLNDIDDITGEEYQRQVEVHDYSVRFSPDEHYDEDRIYDDVFPLDSASETINVYDLLTQAILLQEPLVHIKPGNEHLLDNYQSDEDDYEDSGLGGNNNIVFH